MREEYQQGGENKEKGEGTTASIPFSFDFSATTRKPTWRHPKLGSPDIYNSTIVHIFCYDQICQLTSTNIDIYIYTRI